MRPNDEQPTKPGSKPAAKRTRALTKTAPRVRSPRVTKKPFVTSPDDDEIRLRAYELFLQRDGRPGDPLEDWLRAERELIGVTLKSS
jgi:Protein of unknown function (DUF2934)